MRFIEDFHDYHKKDKEIWILGSGPSLCDFPKRFFSRKITIALNWTVIAFPKCTYWFCYHECFREYLRNEKPEFLEKTIILYSRFWYLKEFLGELISRPILMKFWDTRPIPKTAFEQVIKYIMEKQTPPRGYRASMTVAHAAIQAAAIMGARKIILAGCEHRGANARCYGMDAYYRAGLQHSDPRAEAGTRWSAEIFGEYGIEVVRYFYKKGYQRII